MSSSSRDTERTVTDEDGVRTPERGPEKRRSLANLGAWLLKVQSPMPKAASPTPVSVNPFLSDSDSRKKEENAQGEEDHAGLKLPPRRHFSQPEPSASLQNPFDSPLGFPAPARRTAAVSVKQLNPFEDDF